MAKSAKSVVSPLVAGFRGNVQWYNLHGFLERNSRANSFGNPLSDLHQMIRPLTGEETEANRTNTGDGLVSPMLGGWEPLAQEFVEVTIPTKDEIEQAIGQRRERLVSWANDSKDEDLRHLSDWVKDYWFPNGEPAAILGIVNMSYRRTYAAAGVAYARFRRGIDKSGQYDIPVLVKEYASKLDAYMRHLIENLGKDAGRKDYTPLDFVRVAHDLKAMGSNEAALRRFGKVGEAQRAFAAVSLDRREPTVHLYDRLMLPPTTLDEATGKLPYFAPADDPKGIGSYIPYRGMNKEDLRALLDDKQPGTASIKTAPTQVLTADTLEAYIMDVTAGGRKVMSWSANDTKNLLVESSADVFRFVGWLMSTGKRAELQSFVAQHGATLDAAAIANGFDLDAYKRNGGSAPPVVAKQEAAGKGKGKGKGKRS